MSIRRLGIEEGYAMPAHRPYYPPLPTYYRDVRFQLVYFRAEPDRLRNFLPEPLEPADDGLCVAFGIDVPFSSSYGPFHESGIQIKCAFHDQSAFFNSHLYLDNVPAICSGRERWGAPKEYADVSFEQQNNLLVSRTIKDGVNIMTLTSEIGAPVEPDALIPMFPSYRLKLIPRADGPGSAVKQLVEASPQDVTTHLLYSGSGTVAFAATANSDLRPFGPVEEVAAFYQISSYTESYGRVVYDYLSDEEFG
ncbi:acetoacetate decarboxylase family protein [Chloroflexi bacterium TSY]|nr:acetoacetate decarboxylase family protein [Chloroflexi bacterium TSY]